MPRLTAAQDEANKQRALQGLEWFSLLTQLEPQLDLLRKIFIQYMAKAADDMETTEDLPTLYRAQGQRRVLRKILSDVASSHVKLRNAQARIKPKEQ